MTKPLVGFVGMSHLGLNSAVAGAERGSTVMCFDTNRKLISGLERGEMPIAEPRLDELIAKNHSRLHYTSDAASLVRCDIVYVAQDVATDGKGQSDLTALDSLLDIAFEHADRDATIVVLSQVPPGYTRARQRPGRSLIYQVETLIFGRAIERALHPERYIIGLADPAAPLPRAYNNFLRSHGDPPLLPMRYESAELAKISINCCLVASISVANMLAELCENIGAHWSEIAPALRLDQRIGEYSYLAPGLGIAGGNLERDLATVLRLAKQQGSDAGIVNAWIANSEHRKDWSYQTVKTEILDGNPAARIAVLGLAYKENTHSTKNSPAITCLNRLRKYNVAVHDPRVKGDVVPFADDCATVMDCAIGADVLMVLTPWPEFKAIDPSELIRVMKGRLIIDPYRCIAEAQALSAGFDYITLGAPPARAVQAAHA